MPRIGGSIGARLRLRFLVAFVKLLVLTLGLAFLISAPLAAESSAATPVNAFPSWRECLDWVREADFGRFEALDIEVFRGAHDPLIQDTDISDYGAFLAVYGMAHLFAAHNPQESDAESALSLEIGLMFTTMAALEKSDPVGMAQYGILLQHGLGVERDIERSVYWQERALDALAASDWRGSQFHSFALANLAELHQGMGRDDLALPLARMVVLIEQEPPWRGASGHAVALNRLAMSLRRTGNPRRALPLYRQAKVIFEATSGADGADYATSLNNLARAHHELGEYAQALRYAEQAVELGGKLPEPEKNVHPKFLNTLAGIYYDMAVYEEALPLFELAAEISRQLPGDNRAVLAISLNNLAGVHLAMGNAAPAGALLEESADIRREVLGESHPDYATALDNLADLLFRKEDYGEAAKLYRQAKEIRETALGDGHPDYAASLNNQAALLALTGEPAAAVPLLERARDIYRRTLGVRHAAYAACMKNLALTFFLLGDGRALDTALAAFDADAGVIDAGFAALGERRRVDLLDQRGDLPLRIALSLALSNGGQPSAALDAAWSMLVRGKGRVLDSILEERLGLTGDPEAEELFERLGRKKSAIANERVRLERETDGAAAAESRRRLEAYEDAREQIERRVAERSRLLGGYVPASALDVGEISKSLPDNTALIEFVRFTPLAAPGGVGGQQLDLAPGTALYAALVARGGWDSPRIFFLPNAERIDARIRRCHQMARGGYPIKGELRTLHREVWEPIAAAVAGAERLLLSPDGLLNLLSFAPLLDESGVHLVERHEIAYVASGRDLVRRVSTMTTAAPPALFGDPDFGMAQNPAADSQGRPTLDAAPRFRGLFSVLDLPPLPATRGEVEGIAEKLSGRSPRVYLGGEASEYRLKRLRSPEILHLATHGFFIEPPEEENRQFAKWRGNALGDAMRRSGLALSGAGAAAGRSNAIGQGEDGIVTAEEVGALDLRGTRLVAVSACDTARGDVHSGEGVMGLRRAFTRAGAAKLLLTLWRIEDVAASEFMLVFYDEYLEGGDAVAALAKTQRRFLAAAVPAAAWAPFLISVQGRAE